MADLAQIPKIGEWAPTRYVSSSPNMRESPDMMTRGSENFMLTGLGKLQVFKGLTIIPGKLGSIVMMNVAEDFAGLGSGTPYGPTSVIDGTAFGNVFNVFSALFFIGKGLLRVSGVDALSYKPSPPAPLPPPVPVVADTTLQLLVKYNGSYTDPLSGPWQAGLAQPSAPSIQAVNPPTGFSGKVNGVVSVVTWRIRSTTGAVSIQSEVSNIVSAFNQSIAVTLPLPDANGQDYWGIGVTLNQEGSTGSHFELTEIPESDVSHSVVKVNMAITAGSPTIQSVGATFTSDMIGWPVILSGGTPDIGTPFNSYVIAVPAADQLTLAANAPTTSTGVHMTASTGAAGTPRTVVVEWRDGDLVGKPLAPTRDFPPPEGLYAGSLQDLTFVDGCYGDNSLTPTSNRPSAIAPSEFGKPESFSPDTVIFTNDTPVGLIRGDEVYWRLCKNSVYVLRYIQGLSVEPVWQNMGCDYQHNAVLGEGGRLYMWPTKRGPIRMDYYGLVDASFAVKIADDLIDCTDAVQRVLGWYDDLHVVVFCYGKKIWPWFADLEEWGAPADLTGLIAGDHIVSAVTVARQLQISDDKDNLYIYDVGTGSVGKVRTAWIPSSNSMDTVAAIIASIRADNTTQPVTIKVFADGDDDTEICSFDLIPPRTGFQRLPAIWPNVQDCEMHKLEITITSTTPEGDCGLELAESFGSGHAMLR